MIGLRLVRPHWINDQGDDPEDLCAHGHVELVVNEQVFLDGNAEHSCTVSAAALFLLRTIERDHLPESTVSHDNCLFPCCGFNVWPEGEHDEAMILGCNAGTDVWVRHVGGSEVELALGEKSVLVGHMEWVRAVVRFAEQVKEFYALGQPKVEIEDGVDKQGWGLFWSEFDRLLRKYRHVV